MMIKILKYALKGAIATGLFDKAKSKVIGYLRKLFEEAMVKAEGKLEAKVSDLIGDKVEVQKLVE